MWLTHGAQALGRRARNFAYMRKINAEMFAYMRKKVYLCT